MKKLFLLMIGLAAIFGAAMMTVSCSETVKEYESFYTVTFDTDGGTPSVPSQKIKSGELVVPPAVNPQKQGYVFIFWHLSGASTAYNFQTLVNSDITLEAKWEDEANVEYWQVTWVLNGGVFPADSNHATQVVKGGTLAEPNEPTKAGSTFDGWYREDALTNRVSFPYDVSGATANITLYAKWIESNSTLTGTVTITGVANVGYTLTANTGNLSGNGTISYQWKRCDTKDAAGTDITLNGTGSDYTPVAADIGKFIKVTVSRAGYSDSITSDATDAVTDSPYAEYFGTWRETYDETWDWSQMTISADKIVYLGNNGSGSTMEGLTWTELVVDRNDYAANYPAGYRIAGTNGDVEGLLISNDKQSIMRAGYWITGGKEYWEVSKELTYIKRLNAPETEFWQVTWELNGGVWSYSPAPTQVPKDGAIYDFTAKKTGYDLEGWYFDAALTNRVTFPIIASSLTGDITLYAKWTEPAPPDATLRITVNPGGTGWYSVIYVQRLAGGVWGNYATVPTSPGTYNIGVSSGTYRISYTYWTCPQATCMFSGSSGSFTVSSGQTRNFMISGNSVF